MVKSVSLTTAAIQALATGDSSILYNNQTRDLVLYSGSIGFNQSSVFNLEISNISGHCLVLKNSSVLASYVNFNVTANGQLDIVITGDEKKVNIANHNGINSGLSLGGSLVLATATELNKLSGLTTTTEELNYLDTTKGIAEANKALIVDENRNISNIHNLQTDNLTVNGTLVTSSATELNYNDIATIGTAESAKALVVDEDKNISGINNLTANNLTGTLQTSAQPNITSIGVLTSLDTNELKINNNTISATAAELNVLDGITATTAELNLLDGVTATTDEINYIDVATKGVAEANKALVVDENRNISNIHNLETDNLTVNGTLVTSSATELNYNDITTIGTAEPAKALVVDMDKNISGINNLSAINLNGTLQTSDQLNITSVGVLTSLDTIELKINNNTVTANANELNVLDGITSTTTELNKLHGVTATTNELNKLSGLTSSTNELNILTGVTATYSEINVLNGITATTNELNYVDTTQGTAEASKALILDVNRDITNIRNLTATNVTATTLTLNGNVVNLSNYLQLTGGTLSGALTITRATNGSSIVFNNGTAGCSLYQFNNGATYFGTTTDSSLHLQTNGTNRLEINSSGQFGFGTLPNSSYRLNVSGNVNLSSASDYYIDGITFRSILQTQFDSRYVGINLNGGDGIINGARSFVNTLSSSATDALTFRNPESTSTFVIAQTTGSTTIGTRTNSTLSIMTNNTSRLFITNTGNFGFGVAPSYKMDVDGDINITGSFRVNGTAISTSGGGSFAGGEINNNITAIRPSITASSLYNAYPLCCRHNVSTDGALTGISFTCITSSGDTTPGASIMHRRVGANSQGNLEFYTKGGVNGTDALTERLRILFNGNVGINNSNPQYRLDVGGDINITGSFRVNGTAISTSSSSSVINATNSYQLNGTQIVDSARNITNIGAIFSHSIANNIYEINNSNGFTRISHATASLVGQWTNIALPGNPNVTTRYYSLWESNVEGEGAFIGLNGDTIIMSSTGDYNSINYYDEDSPGNTAVWTISSSGGLSSASDERLKDIIGPYFTENILEKIIQLNPISYTIKRPENCTRETDKYDRIIYGLSAQQSLPIFPEIVNLEASGYYSINYSLLPIIFITGFKEINTKLIELENELIEKENKITTLENKLNTQEQLIQNLISRIENLENN